MPTNEHLIKVLHGRGANYVGAISPNSPGNTGGGFLWVDTSEGPNEWRLKVRNVDNTDWEELGYSPMGAVTTNIYVSSSYNVDAVDDMYDNTFPTFTGAVARAIELSPAEDNQITIVCMDAALYTESFTLPQWVHINAENASLLGLLTLTANQTVRFRNMEAPANNSQAILKATAGRSFVYADHIENHADGGTGILNLGTSSILVVEVGAQTVNSGAVQGIGVGDLAATTGHTHYRAKDLYLASDSAIGVAVVGTGNFVGFIDHILNLDGATSTLGIYLGANGIANLMMNENLADVAYQLDSSTATLHIIANRITGSRVVTTGAFIDERSDVRMVKAETSAMSDADILAGHANMWLDESGGNLVFRIRKSDGNYETVTLAFDP